MKIAFIDPPWPGNGHRTQRWPHKNLAGDINPPPLFQMYAAAVARKVGHEVALWDAPAEKISIDKLVSMISFFRPQMAVINTSTPSFNYDSQFIQILKTAFPEIIIVAVGTHVSFFKSQIINDIPELDIIAFGEYDSTISQIASNINELDKINGIIYRENNEPVETDPAAGIPEIDLLPFPAYDLIDVNLYSEFLFPPGKSPIATIVSSRGCPYGCSFCVYPQLMTGKKIRYHSIEYVLEEIQWLKKDFGVKFIYFDDDTFTASWERVEQMCGSMIDNKIKIPWGCLGRVNGVNSDGLKLMHKAGCYLIKFGVESGNQSHLDKIDKNLKLEDILHAFKLTRKSGIYSHATVMFGVPGETEKSILETHNILEKLKPDFVQFSACTPFPGTNFYFDALENGWLKFENWENFDGAWDCVTEYPQLSREKIKAAVQDAYKTYYLTTPYLLQRIKRSISGPGRISQIRLNFGLLNRYIKRFHAKKD